MSLSTELAATASTQPESFESLTCRLPVEWIKQALQATGIATVRKRRLPAQQVVWLVLGMALMRNRSVEEVVAKLDLALPSTSGAAPAASSIAAARQRVGAAPLKWLFEQSAALWGHSENSKFQWRGLSLYGMDGTTMAVADSPENRAHFGAHSNGPRRRGGAYPLVRVLTLVGLRARVLVAARVAPYVGSSEQSLSDDLIEDIPDDSLFIADRNFLGDRLLLPLLTSRNNRHFLMRAKTKTVMRPKAQLGPGDGLVELNHGHGARKKAPTLPATWIARAIHYQRPNHPPQVLLTSLLDARKYPAAELIAIYHERWDLELDFGEVKTTQLEQRPALRSKLPETVEQEVWAVLLTHNLVRLEMAEMAHDCRILPNRISYIAALHLVRDEWLWAGLTKPGAIPGRLRDMRASLARFILPQRRSERAYPRVVKQPTKHWPIKNRLEKQPISGSRGA